jgi:hypothetical protein
MFLAIFWNRELIVQFIKAQGHGGCVNDDELTTSL